MAWMGRSEDLFPRDCNFKAILYDYVKRHKAPEIQSNLISIMNWASARSAFPLHVCMGMWLSVGRSVCLSVVQKDSDYIVSVEQFRSRLRVFEIGLWSNGNMI